MKNHYTRIIRPFDITLKLFTTEKAFHSWLKRCNLPAHEIKNTADATTVSYSKKDKLQIFVVMCREQWEKIPTTTCLSGLVFHESIHVWQECLSFIGETSPGDELEAYHIQDIGQWIMRGLLYDLDLDKEQNK